MRTKYIWIPLLVAIILTTAITVYSEKVRDGVAQNVLRLHVLANSDDPADQNLKLRVRDRLLRESGEMFRDSQSLADTRMILDENRENLTRAAEEEIALAGYDYSVSIETGKFSFPIRQYENISLPAGEYEAVRVKIGQAEGENWWCVMFPPLCFVDAAMGESNDESLSVLKENLSGEEYALIANGPEGGVNIRFKVVDFFNASVETVKTAFR